MTVPDDPSLAALAGQWQLVRAELDGEPAHELVTTNTTLRLDAREYEVRFGGEVADRGSLALEASGGNPVLVLSAGEGPHAGRVIRSIFQVRGSMLRICYGLDGVAPDAFATHGGSQRYLATYRRADD